MSYQNAVISQRNSGDLRIVRADGCAFAREVGADFACDARSLAIEWIAIETGEQCSEHSKIGFASLTLVCAVIQLCFNHIA